MKTSSKDIKKISVDMESFYYVIHEKRNFVRMRIYSAMYKTSYFDFYFTWKDNWLINFYKPSIAEHLIRYAMKTRWDYRSERQVEQTEDASFLIEKLKLSEVGV